MNTANGDRNLLFGILALQMDFISRDALVQAMHAWVLDKAKPLSQILVEQGGLSAARRALLEPLVQEHIQQHGGDAGQSLAAVSSIGSARDVLKQIADPDVQASLVNLPTTDPNATKYPSAGDASAVGRRFLILRPHAEGGLGKVSVALDGELNREVALKEIHEQYADHSESRSRFLLEAEITGGLEHPSIVPVYGLGRYEDGRPFYAMRFIKGDSLKEAVERFHKTKGPINAGKRALELRQLLGRFNDVCDAIAYAHSRGVLHRDLKPGNVMLGKYGETLVVDWGLAKPAGGAASTDVDGEASLRPASGDGSAATQMGSAIGTPQFMPPEQAAGRLDQMGPASDVYSLGATLYCLLTGKPPFTDRDVGVVLQKVQRGDFPPPRQVRREIPPALEAICLKAMALRPADRYPTARALAGDIEKWLADEPVSAYREPWRVRASRWARRNQTLVAATAAGLLVALLAGGAGAFWYQHDQSVRATERANKAHATERDVTAALDEAATLGKQAWTLRDDPIHWETTLAEALSAVKRADGLLHSGEGTKELKRRVAAQRQELEEADKDRRMVARLEDARLQGSEAGKQNGFDMEGEAALYSAAFEDYMRLSILSNDEAADEINNRAIREELLASLADWSNETPNEEDQERLRGILKSADSDPKTFRNRWDMALAAKDSDELLRLALGSEINDQPAARVVLLGRQLRSVDPAAAIKMLKAANVRRPADFWLLFELAHFCYESKPAQLDDAIRYYTGALSLRPTSGTVHNNLGNALFEQGRLEDAATEYRRAIELDPKDALPRVNLSFVLSGQGKQEEAITECRKAIDLDSKGAWPHTGLAHVLRSQGKNEEAIAELRKAIELDPKDVHAHNDLGSMLRDKGKHEAAIAEYRKCIELDPKSVDAHIALGYALHEQRKLVEADDEYREAIKLAPKYALAHTLHADMLNPFSKNGEAIAEYRKAIELDPKDAAAHAGLAKVLDLQGKHAEAAAEFRRAIELDSKDARAHSGLGGALLQLGKPEEAIAEYQKVIELDPKDVWVRYSLGVALLGPGRQAEAVAEFRKAIELDPKFAPAHRSLANELLRQGKQDEAIAEFRKAIELDPKDAFARTGLGFALYHHGKREEAAAEFRRAIDLDPKYAAPHKGLGMVLLDQREWKEAAAEYRSAIQLNPNDAACHGNLGLALYHQAQFIEAKQAFQRGLELSPVNDDLRKIISPELQRCERIIALEKKLPAILKGDAQPADAAEQVQLALLCYLRKRYADAARFYADAFAVQPTLADDVQTGNRYNAAVAASLAATGQGEGSDKMDDKERARLRKQALDWLRADLALWAKQAKSATPQALAAVQQALRYWQEDPDLASVRDAAALVKLPEAERAEWKMLWAEVEELLKKSGESEKK